MKFLRLIPLLLFAGSAFGQGACPSGVPTGITGNHCYFIAGNGLDTNNGTSESTPWLHAPGMPNCANTCGGVTPASGQAFIFRGGDTWHFGNSGASPYTGGSWNFSYAGGVGTTHCWYELTLSGCIYVGVDTSTPWYNSGVCGGSWCRPILNGDNPPCNTGAIGTGNCVNVAGFGAEVTACVHATGSSNSMLSNVSDGNYFDNFEVTGFCGSNSSLANTMVAGLNDGGNGGMFLIYHFYVHGWSTTSVVNTANTDACIAFGGSNEGLETMVGNVFDGTDSNPGVCHWALFPSFYHVIGNEITQIADGIGSNCHDIHDNIFEYMVPIGNGGHTNILECNQDYSGGYGGPTTANVVYNNIARHLTSNVGWWFCTTAVPEYWFNNLVYDYSGEGIFQYVGVQGGGATYPGCTNTGGTTIFNNTVVDQVLPCSDSLNDTAGTYVTALNNHLIGSTWDNSGSPTCTGGPASATNVNQSDATATSQGYTTGTAGTYQANNCAHDTTTPCITPSGGGTVGAGANHTAYCTTLAGFSTETAIGTDAANACKAGTDYALTYNATNHTTSWPAQSAPSRPSSGAWDSGVYELLGALAPNVSPAAWLMADDGGSSNNDPNHIPTLTALR